MGTPALKNAVRKEIQDVLMGDINKEIDAMLMADSSTSTTKAKDTDAETSRKAKLLFEGWVNYRRALCKEGCGPMPDFAHITDAYDPKKQKVLIEKLKARNECISKCDDKISRLIAPKQKKLP